jgi:hypothetical protein
VLTHCAHAKLRRAPQAVLWRRARRRICRLPPAAGGAGALLAGLSVAALVLLLSGCAEIAADTAPKTEAHAAFVRRTDVSLAGVSVAFVSVEGPPAAISRNFSQIMTREATARDIAVADDKKARYLVRGYLSAYATTDGAAVEYVWDVFNKDKQRTQRVNDVLEVKGEGADPWRIVGEAALTSVAAKSADDLAAYLSNTPEAVAAAPTQPIAVSESKPLSYAPAN